MSTCITTGYAQNLIIISSLGSTGDKCDFIVYVYRSMYTQLKCQVTSHLFTVSFSPTKLSSSCPFCNTGTCLQSICSVTNKPVEGKQRLGSWEVKSSWYSGDPLLLHFISHHNAWDEALSGPWHQQSTAGRTSSICSIPTTAGAFCCPSPRKVLPGHSSLPELEQVPIAWLSDPTLISSTPRAPALPLIHLIL